MLNYSSAILILISLCLSEAKPVLEENPIVTVAGGQIKGNILKTRLGADFYGFRGIRYGKAPVGDLRFKAPVPVENWENVFDATLDGPMCPQLLQPASAWSEDCLRLNVYTHELFKAETDVKRPVLVYFPGGGLYIGSGVSNHYSGPQYLMDQDIVFVAINYRLGFLGYLSLGTKNIPGNAGFKDQVIALRWIKDNIAKFGGDPDQITLMGNSAGGLSIGLLMVSPMAQGLFHRAILMSGSVVESPKAANDEIYLAKRLAQHFNCSDETTDDIAVCLQDQSAQDLIESQSDMFEFWRCPGFLWRYVIENDYGQERLLIADPYEQMLIGNYTKIPIIMGITRDELVGPALGVVMNETVLNYLDENFKTVAPICLLYERNTSRSFEISNKLRTGYNLSHPLSSDQLWNLAHMFSDAFIGYGVHEMAEVVQKDVDVFYYQFSYQGRHSHVYYPDDKPFGVGHSDDLFYLLKKHTASFYTPNDPESEMVAILGRLWAVFATTGNPNKKDDPVIGNFSWPKYTDDTKLYLDIGEKLVVKDHMFENRYKIWDEIHSL